MKAWRWLAWTSVGRGASPAQVSLFSMFVHQRISKVSAILPPGPRLALPAFRDVQYPPEGDPEIFVEPVEGETETDEALIVVASSRPLLMDRMAGPIGRTPEESLANAVTLDAFNANLAGLGAMLDDITIAYLPLRVRRKP